MPILRPCAGPGCRELIELGGRNRCPRSYKLDNRRRAAKQRAAGRTTAHWRRLKAQEPVHGVVSMPGGWVVVRRVCSPCSTLSDQELLVRAFREWDHRQRD
jgi:hypothetical protein